MDLAIGVPETESSPFILNSASVLISLGYVPRPSAESPVSFDPPAPSERLWDALAELKTQFTEELGTKEINQITLEKQETVGSGTTAVEKVTGLVPCECFIIRDGCQSNI